MGPGLFLAGEDARPGLPVQKAAVERLGNGGGRERKVLMRDAGSGRP